MFSRLYKVTTNLFLALSIAAAPLYGEANNIYLEPAYEPHYETACSCEENQNPHCQTRPSWGRWLGGALLASIVIGAVVGASVGNRKEGHCGPIGKAGDSGPVGSAFAEQDGTNTVTFEGIFNINAEPVLPSNTSVVFFVTLPDGSIIRTSPFHFVNASLTPLPSLTVPALFGKYSVGVELTVGPILFPSIATSVQLSITADPSNNNALNTMLRDPGAVVTFQASTSNQACQVVLDYTYYPEHAATP